MADKLGIEALQEAVEVAIAFPVQAAKTIKGKFKLFDLLAFLDEFRKLADVIGKRKQVAAEFKDLDADEREIIKEKIKELFDIPNDKLEVFIENALDWLDATITLVEEAKQLKK